MKLLDLRDEFHSLKIYLPAHEQGLIPQGKASPLIMFQAFLSNFNEYIQTHEPSSLLCYLVGRGCYFLGKEKELHSFYYKTQNLVLDVFLSMLSRRDITHDALTLQAFLEQETTILKALLSSLIIIIQHNFIFNKLVKINQIRLPYRFSLEQIEHFPYGIRSIIYTDLAYKVILDLYYKYLMGETTHQNQYLEEGLFYLSRSNHKSILARYLEFKGILLFDRGYYQQAYQHFEEGARLSMEANDVFQFSFLTIRFSKFYLLEGRYFIGHKYLSALHALDNYIFKLPSIHNYLTFTKIMFLVKEENYTSAKEELNAFLNNISKASLTEITVRDSFSLLQLMQVLNFDIGVQSLKEKFYTIQFYPKNLMKFVIDAIFNKLAANYYMSLKNIERAIKLLSQINDDFLLFLLYVEKLDLLLKIQLLNWNFLDELKDGLNALITFIHKGTLGKLGQTFLEDLKRLLPPVTKLHEITPDHCAQVITLIQQYHLNFWLIETPPAKVFRSSKILYLSIINEFGEVFVDTGGTEDLLLVNKALRQFLEAEKHTKTTTMNVDIGKFQIFSITLPSKKRYRLIAVAREIDNKTRVSLETASKTIDEDLLSLGNKSLVRNILDTLLEL